MANPALAKAMANLDQARAFTTNVQDAQKSEGLWLAQHPFVQAVRTGSVRREEIQRWVRGAYRTARTYSEILESLGSQPPESLLPNARRDLDLLLQLGEALGVTQPAMLVSQKNAAAQSVEEWMQEHIAVPNDTLVGLICWTLVEAMSPDVADCLAEGVERHFGLDDEQIEYFTIGMKSKLRADEYAIEMLSRTATDRWDSFRTNALVISRLVVRLYDSAGDMWSSW
jgi:pyrroloquinoline quinone (PQQ) biosynthesis protein C